MDGSDTTSGTGGRRTGRRWAVAGGGIAALAAAGLLATTLGGPGDDGDDGGTGAPVGLGRVQAVALQSFENCDALLAYYRDNAAKLVTPYGLDGTSIGGYRTFGGGRMAMDDVGSAASGGVSVPQAATAESAAKAADSGATSETGTNVQVAGVDEADVAKLSGDELITLQDGRWLHVMRAGRTVTELSRLDIAPPPGGTTDPVLPNEKRIANIAPIQPFQPQQLLVHGSTVIVTGSLTEMTPLASTDKRAIADFAPMYETRSRVMQVDLANPAQPRIVRTLDVDGNVAAARLVDGVLRLVVTSSPHRLTWRQPTPNRDGSVSKKAQQRATETNRRTVAKAGLDTWLPDYQVTDYDAAGRTTPGEKGRLVGCGDVASPRKFAGLDTLSLLSADLDADGIAAPETTAVVARGATVYATPEHTYVATTEWQAPAATTSSGATKGLPVGGSVETSIHLFETRQRTQSTYLASGTVAGTLLSQFAMDEYEGVLRVASTTQPGAGLPMPVEGDGAVSSEAAPGGGTSGNAGSSGDQGSAATTVAPSPAPSESRVTVLRRDGEALLPAGLVSGLGKTEQIRSVRFIGDLGYVVTFRQTDPLYTIDLSDPAKPKVAGELKILGYSAYLHPAGPGRLLGVGQDADDGGRVKGMQMSLFDISDPANPKRLDAVGVGDAWTDVEGDHHAFTFSDGLALAPFQRWWQLDPSSPASDSAFDTGVLAVRLGGAEARDLQASKLLRPIADGPVRQPVSGQMSPADQKVMTASPQRTFVRDGVVYTVTNLGIATHDAASLNRLGFVTYR